ncbi:hypothetical protein B9Z55_005267 [Caenorhabditis nigoni]|uniref:AAA+ ATPase domain-containing protein n=1 Tax=Caenorhabditis nigoni TaxID=1611254 RepID=A0A2G5V037_9PELO|nr:hypothetical protein B9Z55_005267 [Caenorhabditis nigoni]
MVVRALFRAHPLARISCRYSSLAASSFNPKPYIPSVSGVQKSVPFDNLLEQYSRIHWDDTVTYDDPTVQKLFKNLMSGSRAALASAITLVESRHPTKRAQGNMLLKMVLDEEREKYKKYGRDSMIFRVGISGSPGVGKSSFIEALGAELTENRGKKVAVLTIDPTSAMTGGSVLGDLTRMQELSRNPRAYIRQSPTSGSLGGVTRGIHEAVILCEGAGYDIVIIETVGVGQSETSVSDMCDMMCLLLSPAHGDELQGVKRGIMEMSDLLVVTKDDGDLQAKAKMTQAEYISALKFMRPRLDVWRPKVMRSSIMNKESVSAVCTSLYEFWDTIGESGDLERRRQDQMKKWMWNHVKDEIMAVFQKHPKIAHLAPKLEKDISSGKITPGLAAETMIRTFFGV